MPGHKRLLALKVSNQFPTTGQLIYDNSINLANKLVFALLKIHECSWEWLNYDSRILTAELEFQFQLWIRIFFFPFKNKTKSPGCIALLWSVYLAYARSRIPAP